MESPPFYFSSEDEAKAKTFPANQAVYKSMTSSFSDLFNQKLLAIAASVVSDEDLAFFPERDDYSYSLTRGVPNSEYIEPGNRTYRGLVANNHMVYIQEYNIFYLFPRFSRSAAMSSDYKKYYKLRVYVMTNPGAETQIYNTSLRVPMYRDSTHGIGNDFGWRIFMKSIFVTRQGILYFDYDIDQAMLYIWNSSNGTSFSLIQSIPIEGGPGFSPYNTPNGTPMYEVNASGLCGVLAFEGNRMAGSAKYVIYRSDNSFITYTKATIDANLFVRKWNSPTNEPSLVRQDFTMLDNGFGWFLYWNTSADQYVRMITMDAGRSWIRTNIYSDWIQWIAYKPECTINNVPIMMLTSASKIFQVGDIILKNKEESENGID